MEEFFFYLENNKKEVVANNLNEKCYLCLNTSEQKGYLKNCLLNNCKRRLGKIITRKGISFLCSNKIKTTKLFKQILESYNYSIPFYEETKNNLKDEISKEERKQTEILMHNLITLNGHNKQEIFNLIPQELIIQNIEHQIDFIKEYIEKDKNKSAKTLLRLAKNNLRMANEFSVFNNLYLEYNYVKIRKYKIRNVLLNVLHTFFLDFSENNIYVKVNDDFNTIKIDYDTVSVAFYNIFDDNFQILVEIFFKRHPKNC